MEKKNRKGVQNKKLTDTPCEININTVAEEDFSSENSYLCITVNEEEPQRLIHGFSLEGAGKKNLTFSIFKINLLRWLSMYLKHIVLDQNEI